MTYLALLRGINVGGANKVAMAKLKLLFEQLKFKNVTTFIASGNVVFISTVTDRTKLTDIIEAAIKKEFGFPIKVLVRTIPEIQRIIKVLPASWVNDKDIKCDVMFLWKEIDNPAILKQLPFNKEIEDVKYVSGAVLWRIDRAHASKSRMFKIVKTQLYQSMTIRNPNTVRKLYKLMQASQLAVAPPLI